jgi:hypothetical protein
VRQTSVGLLLHAVASPPTRVRQTSVGFLLHAEASPPTRGRQTGVGLFLLYQRLNAFLRVSGPRVSVAAEFSVKLKKNTVNI